uniref:Leucine rich repeat containing 59 n=2 Tax=Cercopithecinae TaxID=9528 RepID=A0A2K6A535_MANLE
MTKAGSKGGNLRDKLDGNELDLSLSDLNEVPVKELVSIVPRDPGAHLRLALAPVWATYFPKEDLLLWP